MLRFPSTIQRTISSGLAIVGLCVTTVTHAESGLSSALVNATALIDLRLRFEDVALETKERRAYATTLRSRLGFETGQFLGFSALAEGDFVIHADAGHFNDVVNGRTQYPVIFDPGMAALNRLQLNYRTAVTPDARANGRNDLTIVVGRQRIILGDARFIGNAPWRQHEQTFDAVSVSDSSLPDTVLNYVYLERVNRVFGPDTPLGRFDSNSHLFNAVYAGFGPVLKIEAYEYLLNLHQAPALSTATYGVRAESVLAIDGDLGAHFTGAYARQSRYGANPVRFDLAYYLAEAGLLYGGLSATAGYEVLQGNGVTGFSTPLASLHGFQGWAEQFLSDPPNGIRDTYARIRYAIDAPEISGNVVATLIAHDFEAEHVHARYGSELDGSLEAFFSGGTMLGAALADFSGRGGFANKTVFWLYAGYKY